jgi:hypothetical protein
MGNFAASQTQSGKRFETVDRLVPSIEDFTDSMQPNQLEHGSYSGVDLAQFQITASGRKVFQTRYNRATTAAVNEFNAFHIDHQFAAVSQSHDNIIAKRIRIAEIQVLCDRRCHKHITILFD